MNLNEDPKPLFKTMHPMGPYPPKDPRLEGMTEGERLIYLLNRVGPVLVEINLRMAMEMEQPKPENN